MRSLEAGGCFSRRAFNDFCEGSAGLSADIKRRIAALMLPSLSLADMAWLSVADLVSCLTLESGETLSTASRKR